MQFWSTSTSSAPSQRNPTRVLHGINVQLSGDHWETHFKSTRLIPNKMPIPVPPLEGMDKCPRVHTHCRPPKASEIPVQASPEVTTDQVLQHYNQASVMLHPSSFVLLKQHNTTLMQLCTGWHTCPLMAVLCVAVPMHGQPAPLRGARVLSSPALPLSIRTILQACVSEDCASGRESHTNTNTNGKPSVCRAEPWITVQETVVMTVHGWRRTTAFELAARTLYKRVPYISGHCSCSWLKLALSQWLEDKEVFC